MVERISGLVRRYDVLFRYGGDEFVLLLPDTDRAEALRVALRLTDGVREQEFAGSPPLRVSVSLGVALYPDDADDAEGLLACADRRNYLAKQRGRACAVGDDAETDLRSLPSRLLERDSQLSTVHEFLTRVMAAGGGALRVAGEPGAGHTRFLELAGRAGVLRGFAVLDASFDPQETVTAGPAGILVIADRGHDGVADAVGRAAAAVGDGGAVSLCFAAAGGDDEPPAGVDLGVVDTVTLLAWSPAAVRIWLRTVLHGEPSTVLVDWLLGRTGALPANVEREVDRLRATGGLVRMDAGSWTVAPTLLARGARRRQRRLPDPLTEFVGRQREIAQVSQLLADRRLVTLVGAGGIGKTRLSLAVGAAICDRFADGAVFVPLADASTESMVVAALARALGITDVPGQSLVDTLREQLADQSVLLIVDNFEQVLTAAPLLADLLAAAPGVRVLASSRERLGLYGEQAYPVPPLPLPEPGEHPSEPDEIAVAVAGSPALALFVVRARAAAYDFALDADNIGSVIELCRRLDGLPLAIELAAARCDTLSPTAMLAQLRHRLDLPGSGPRDLPARQRTLRDAIEWSAGQLTPADRDLLTRLGVFVGGCRPDAVCAVADDDPGDGLAERLRLLADKSLLQGERDGDGVRYTMLHVIRSYALDRLTETGEAELVRRKHAEHYAAFAERAGAGLTGPEQDRWAARVEQEYENLRAAFGWAHENAEPATAARIGLGLWRFWRAGGHLGDGRQWLARLLEPSVRLPETTRTQVLHAAAVLACAQDDHELGAALARDSLRGARVTGDERTAAQACNALGIAALGVGDLTAARLRFEDSLAAWERQDAPLGMAIAHGNLGKVALRAGDVDAASEHAARCLEIDERQGNTRGVMLGLLCLGEILLIRGDHVAARTRLAEGLALSRTLGDVFGQAMALHHLAEAARGDGDNAEALRLVTDAVALRRDVGDRGDLAVSLEVLGALLAADHPWLAVRLIAAADALRVRYPLGQPANRPELQRTLAALRSTLDAATFGAAWSGDRLSQLDSVVDEAVALAREQAGTATAA